MSTLKLNTISSYIFSHNHNSFSHIRNSVLSTARLKFVQFNTSKSSQYLMSYQDFITYHSKHVSISLERVWSFFLCVCSMDDNRSLTEEFPSAITANQLALKAFVDHMGWGISSGFATNCNIRQLKIKLTVVLYISFQTPDKEEVLKGKMRFGSVYRTVTM